jgi:Zn-dependent peptidase ImmA (M78 family)
MVNKKLIKQIDPKVFTLGHELKHHLMDDITGVCTASNEKEITERGAEIFAAELIYPQADFMRDMAARGVASGGCIPESLVRLKHETQTTLSHTGLAIRAMQLGYAAPGALDKVHWINLRNSMYPEYTRFRRKRT